MPGEKYRILGLRLPADHKIWSYPSGQRNEQTRRLLEQGEMVETLLARIENLITSTLLEQIEILIDQKLEEHLKHIEDLIQEKMKHAAFEKSDDFFREDDAALKKKSG